MAGSDWACAKANSTSTQARKLASSVQSAMASGASQWRVKMDCSNPKLDSDDVLDVFAVGVRSGDLLIDFDICKINDAFVFGNFFFHE